MADKADKSVEEQVASALLLDDRLDQLRCVTDLRRHCPGETLRALVTSLDSPDDGIRLAAARLLQMSEELEKHQEVLICWRCWAGLRY